ncbi:hypothetical protein [Pseudoalteromonas umbrosa]|uniref:hypothetical protein n=1 Tax=Pseudoalteromonas umbrosa TaxID=3048489 RepID=UPI0024C38559|nr:hypothetical protein [Pseudoalteromonas sp. B95]MDK1285946.1 hypothetical protein [Pseudoalteromonas sp. B95]
MVEVFHFNDWELSLDVGWYIFIVFILSWLISFKVGASKSSKIALTVFMISHGLSNATGSVDFDGVNYFVLEAYYLNWSLYDSATVLAIYFLHSGLKVRHSGAVKIAYALSIVNMFSYLAMHYLAFELNYTSHWFYPIYSAGINVTALLIAASLLLNPDSYRLRALCSLKS